MAQVNTYVDLVGAPPAVNTVAFLRWVEDYTYRRKAECVFRRSSSRYIDPVGGNDANDGLLPTTAWASLTNVRADIAANVSDRAYLFKRGGRILDTLGMRLNGTNDRLYFGAYGNPMAIKPTISHFTIRLDAGSIVWTDQGGGRWSATIPGAGATNPSGATQWGWIREQLDPFNPYKSVDGTAQVEAQEYTFYVTGTTIHLNPGLGVDPNTVYYEAVPYTGSAATEPFGLAIVPGATQTWVDGLLFEGWGCVPYANIGAQGVQFGGGDDDVSYVSDCEDYYGGRHAFSHEATGAAGGYSIWERCTTGFACSVAGAAHFNQYMQYGEAETVWKDCCLRFGYLPCDRSIASPGDRWDIGAARYGANFGGHTGGSAYKNALMIVNGFQALDERALFPRATSCKDRFSLNMTNYPGFADQPETIRVFVLNWRPNKGRASVVEEYPLFVDKVHYVNSHFYLNRLSGSAASQFISAIAATRVGWKSLLVNCIFEFDDEEGDLVELFPIGAVSIVAAGSNGITFPAGQPIQIITSASHGLVSGEIVRITGAGTTPGETNINNEWPVTVINDTTLTLSGTVGAGGVAAGGGNIKYRAMPRLLNCMVIFRGQRQTWNNIAHNAGLNNGHGQPYMRVANTLLACPSRLHDSPAGTQTTVGNDMVLCCSRNTLIGSHVALQDDPANLSHIAILGCLVPSASGGSDWKGFGNAEGLVTLTSQSVCDAPLLALTTGNTAGSYRNTNHYDGNSIAPTSLLAGAGSPDPYPLDTAMLPAPEYDFFGRVRPAVPSIGPFDVHPLTANSGGGGGGSGEGSVIDVVMDVVS